MSLAPGAFLYLLVTWLGSGSGSGLGLGVGVGLAFRRRVRSAADGDLEVPYARRGRRNLRVAQRALTLDAGLLGRCVRADGRNGGGGGGVERLQGSLPLDIKLEVVDVLDLVRVGLGWKLG